ncbi:MAG TPA: hypothetical protein VJY54_02590 [Lachnospiraceae bacterium]|nr:hypothetical protein [Lachnospiraceae bacterium]
MPLMDEFRKERDQIKKQPLKKKLAYFWTYYKWFVIGGLIAIILIVTTAKAYMDKKEYALYGVMLNGYSLSQEEEPLATGFEEYAGIDTNKYSVSFNSTLTMTDQMDQSGIGATQFIMVYIAAKDLDVTVMDLKRFGKYANGDTYLDLRELLDADMLDKLSDKLYYVDKSVVEEINSLESSSESTDDVVIPDPFQPENMEKPIPVGIDLSECKKFTDAYYYENNEAYFGVIVNTENRDLALKLIQYLFSE